MFSHRRYTLAICRYLYHILFILNKERLLQPLKAIFKMIHMLKNLYISYNSGMTKQLV